MPRIRCLYEDCVFLSKGMCIASSIELDPEDGCLTYSEDTDQFMDQDFYDEDDEDLDDFEDNWEDEGFEEIDLDESEF